MEKIWYIIDEKLNEATGPFTTDDIIKLLKNKKLHLDDFIYARHLDTNQWQRIFEFDDFKVLMKPIPTCPTPRMFKTKSQIQIQKENMALSFTKEGDYGIENIYRRYPRIPLDAEIIIHDGQSVFFGRTKDISERGTFVRLDTKTEFKVGQEITITMRNLPEEIGTISLTAAIIKESQDGKGQGLSLFFFKINPKIRRQLASIVLKHLDVKRVQAG